MIIEPAICLLALFTSYGIGKIINKILRKYYDKKLIKTKAKMNDLNKKYFIATMGDKFSRRN